MLTRLSWFEHSIAFAIAVIAVHAYNLVFQGKHMYPHRLIDHNLSVYRKLRPVLWSRDTTSAV